MKRTELKRSPFRRTSPAKNFGAKPVYDIWNERFHASKAEKRGWDYLELRERVGEITNLEHQPKVVLVERRGKAPEIAWRMDAAFDEDGRRVFWDVKPRPFTPREVLLMKLWVHNGPGLLLIMEEKRKQGWVVKRRVMPVDIETTKKEGG